MLFLNPLVVFITLLVIQRLLIFEIISNKSILELISTTKT